MKTIIRDENTDEFNLTEDFSDGILNLLHDRYNVNGESVTGQAMSYLQKEIKGKGWKFKNYEFEYILIDAGFSVSMGTNSRNQKCVVVYL